jgi:hypothetical protein
MYMHSNVGVKALLCRGQSDPWGLRSEVSGAGNHGPLSQVI